MPPINVLIKPASGNCNMRCDYCFYYDTMSKRKQPSYGMMNRKTLAAVIEKVLAYAEGSCTIAYQGGEPTLCGLSFFETSAALQNQYNVNHVTIHNALQTNGYHLNREWADFFVKNHFLVGISLDGGPKAHDYYRKNIKGQGTFFSIMKNIELFAKCGVDFNILSVVNAKTAPMIKKNYSFYKKNGLHYLQFISCLDPFGEVPGGREYSLTPAVYGQFLIELFELWYADLMEGKQPFIRQFENYVAILLGQQPESCDMRGICGMQYVVEADGSVYPCDFYVTDEYRLGNFHTHTVAEIDKRRQEIGFIEASLIKAEGCARCKYMVLCRGGCRRTRQVQQGHHQYYCQAYQMFFDSCLPKLTAVAGRIRQYQQ